jgi:pimeloyl-ACP methyl ester carboxylesterase
MAKGATFLLDAGDKSSVASLTLPDDECASFAILVAQPLVEERKCSLRPLVEASRAFADKLGAAVLRIDYPGTGDSPGGFADFTPQDWIAALEFGAKWLADNLGGLPLACLGARSGALLLCASRDTRIATAPKVLWDPIGGNDAVRQWAQRHMVCEMIAFGKARTTVREAERRWSEGGIVDLDGFGLSGAQRKALGELAPAAPSSRTFVVLTSKPAPATDAWLRECGGAVETARLDLPPYWNQVGYVDTAPLRNLTLKWLAEGNAECRMQNAECTTRNAQCGAGPADLSAAKNAKNAEGIGAAPSLAAPAENLAQRPQSSQSFCGGGKSIICYLLSNIYYLRPQAAIPVSIGPIRAFLHRPQGEVKRTVLFLHGWSGDRQGPHRMFVDFARRLAADGVASLRIDFRGRGESDGEDATIASMTDDAEAACNWLKSEGLQKGGLEVAAICSGTKVAIALATRFPPERLVLLSAEAMGSLRAKDAGAAKTLHALRAYARKLLRRETWRKIFKGEVRTDMVGKALVRHETRSAEEAVWEDKVLARFAAFGGELRFIFGGSDPAAAATRAAYGRFCARHGLNASFATVESAGHSYYALDWTDEVFRLAWGGTTALDPPQAPRNRPAV